MRNQEGINIELQKNVHRRICVRDITILTAHPPLYVIFYCFLSLLPFSSQLTYLLNGPIKIHNIAMDVGIIRDDFISFFSIIMAYTKTK